MTARSLPRPMLATPPCSVHDKFVRCATHDLATGPDGHCVLCRRTTGGPPPRRLVWMTGGVAVVLAAATAYGAGIVRSRSLAGDAMAVAERPRDEVHVIVYT